jgi:hypothetical protein
LRSDHSEKSIYRNQGRKSKADFCWILFVMPEDVSWWKWNPFCNIKDEMYWWNFNPFCNIWNVYILPKILYILCLYSASIQ